MKRRALSLIEVIVALVILGLAIPPLLIQIGAGVQQQEAALVQQNLIRLASERLWEIYADHANPTRGYAYIQSSAYPPENAPGGLDGYTRRTTVREVSPLDFLTAQSGSGLKRFRIEVAGPGGHTLTSESLVAQVGTTGGAGSTADATTPDASGPGRDGRGRDRRGRP